MRKLQLVIVFTIGLFYLSFNQVFAQKIILSGVEGGSYNLLAKDIKNITNISLDVVTTGGSVFNFKALIANNDTNVTFLQYDVLLYFKELEPEEKIDNLKILLPMAFEEIHLVTLKDAPINSLKDLKGKRVAKGSLSQGTNVTASLIKIKTETEWVDVDLGFKDTFSALLSGQIDAFFFVGAAPVGKLNELSERSRNLIRLVPIEHPKLEKIYAKRTIKSGTYKWVDYDVNTFSVQSLLVANVLKETEADRANYEKLLTDVKNNLKKLRTEGHPKWKEVDFLFDKINWHIHPVAIKVFGK